ncbi:MAG: iron ABC transporter permease [Desulfobacteraceae bacterium]|nr:iron ABC transporter permease [Desulfobacteraceae bacterium]
MIMVNRRLGFRLFSSILVMLAVLGVVMLLGLITGSSAISIFSIFQNAQPQETQLLKNIIWKLRFPRVLMAALLGATLSGGGLVFQALLRNPLSEPYILGVSGGSAIGAIVGILLGLSDFPGVWLTAFTGSLVILCLLFFISSGRNFVRSNTLLLSGVMVNAFCGAVIMFLISIVQDNRLHSILFWIMGDLSGSDLNQALALAATVLPCLAFLFIRSHQLNLMTMGRELAQSMGINITFTIVTLLTITSLMVSAAVSYCGLVGFVGLVAPHTFRLILGPDHRILMPASILGGAAFMVLCDLLARTLPSQGEMPVGVVTALMGAPVFIYLLRRTQLK